MSLAPDAVLVERIGKGDRAALQALYARHATKVFRYAARLLRDDAKGEDVVSDVFTDVWRGAARFEGRAAVTTWLLSIARFKAITALRRSRDAELDEEAAETIEDTTDDPEVMMQKKGKSEMLRALIMRLSAEHREVIDLVYYHEMSVEEVATVVGIPEGTVKTRMFHARKRLSELGRQAGIDRGWP